LVQEKKKNDGTINVVEQTRMVVLPLERKKKLTQSYIYIYIFPESVSRFLSHILIVLSYVVGNDFKPGSQINLT